jgi:undecaprenyl-diphosphatase
VRVGEVVAVLGGAVLLAASWVVVAAQATVPRWEARLFVAVNDLSNLWWVIVWGPMQVGSLLGSLAVVVATGVISRDRRLTLATLVGSQAAYWLAITVKGLVSRGRPDVFLTGIHFHDRADGFGYVSGHSAVAFALAAVLVPSLPRPWRAVAIAVAVTVAFGRVYAGVHLPLDVVGGAGLGLLCGTFARWGFGLGGEGLPVRPVGEEEAVARE